ncbi:hypothetical protein QTP86_007979 [Hemibagrus guttatus]|nr:hypothetical protein QTP86_007979 [Hemibagrus guttatus]
MAGRGSSMHMGSEGRPVWSDPTDELLLLKMLKTLMLVLIERKSTTDAIFALRILMEKYRDGQRELHCVFVDLEKAYDRVPREELWYCMRKSGVAEKYVRVVQDMYERSRTVVRCAVGQTEEFKVEVGLHQGSALSPFLFAIVMDQLSEEVRQESPWTMMFADDIVICSESREQVEENLERWRFALERRGMKVSRSKTEYMCVNEREGSGTVRLQGEEVKKVQEFKYLGSTVQSNGECGKEVKKRVQAGWNGWRKVWGVLCERKISARIKGKVYRTVVRAAMLYGLETVSLRKRQESELEVAELKMLRFSLGVTRLDRIRNEYIRGTAHVGCLGDKVREARLRWFGHVQRRDMHNIIQRFRESGTISVRKGQGRKTILDARDLRALRRHCITYRNATVMEITTWAQEYFQKTLSVNTIHRAIRRRRLKLYRSKKKPYLNMIQERRRFLWAKANLKWTVAKWKTVLWSDQSKFEDLFGKLGRHVIRTKEDKDNPSCYQRSVQKPASLMVWGCMSACGMGSLHIWKGTINAESSFVRELIRESPVSIAKSFAVDHLGSKNPHNALQHRGSIEAHYVPFLEMTSYFLKHLRLKNWWPSRRRLEIMPAPVVFGFMKISDLQLEEPNPVSHASPKGKIKQFEQKLSAVVSIYQKWSKEGTVVNRRQGHGRPRLIDARGERRLARVVRSNRRATVAQIAEKVNAGSDRKEVSMTHRGGGQPAQLKQQRNPVGNWLEMN